MLRSKFVKVLLHILKWQVSSSSVSVSFFIVMTHNSSVNSKLIHFLFLTKGSHGSPNFDTFQCSGKNLINSSCYFSNHKSVFLQILHHSSLSWKITPLYFFRSNIKYLNTLHNRNQSKCTFVRLLSAWIKIHQIMVIFETTSQFFFKFCITLQGDET